MYYATALITGASARIGKASFDIANAVIWALNQPPHVNVNRVELMPVAQAPGCMSYNRES